MQVSDYLRGARASTAASPLVVRNQADLRRYFEYSASGVEVVEDGLKEITFGEYLVEQGTLDRFQLFRALQMQDRLPGVRLGECAAALGYAPISRIEKLFSEFAKLATVTVD
jgi:hypothetical protein